MKKKVIHPFYKKMLEAKQNKKIKIKKEKIKKQEELLEPPKQKGDNLHSIPKMEYRIEVTEPTHMSKMEESTTPHIALEKALDRIRIQSQGL